MSTNDTITIETSIGPITANLSDVRETRDGDWTRWQGKVQLTLSDVTAVATWCGAEGEASGELCDVEECEDGEAALVESVAEELAYSIARHLGDPMGDDERAAMRRQAAQEREIDWQIDECRMRAL